ncbi:MAG: hypothetical protein ACFFD4_17660 [Candidatus Odinarchaeota archaeon]
MKDLKLSQQQLLIYQQVSELDEDDYLKLYGIKNLKAAEKIRKKEFKLEITSTKGWTINARLISDKAIHNVSVDFSKDFSKASCSCKPDIVQNRKRKQCSHLALLIQAIKKDPNLLKGTDTDNEGEEKEQKLTGEEIRAIQAAAEERKKSIESLGLDSILVDDALDSVQSMVINLVTQGLQRCSPATLERLNDLEIKTQIAKLANINKEIKKLRENIKSYLDKSVLFDIRNYKYRLNQLVNYHELCKNLIEGKKVNHPEVTPVTVIGKFRSEYIPEEDTVAQCLGMRGWLTDTGFIGCSGYYLDLKIKKLISISQALPTQYFGNDPLQIYRLPIKTIGMNLQHLAHGAFSFTNVKLNDKGNISLHKEIGIFPSKIKALQGPEFREYKTDNWLELLNFLYRKEAAPIRLPYQLNNFFVFEPVKWGRFEFDEINQLYTAKLLDQDQNVLLLAIKNEPHNRLIIQNLETVLGNKKMMPNALFGSAFVSRGILSVDPISLLWYQGIYLSEGRRRRRSTGPKLVSEFHLSLEGAENLSLEA